MKKNRTKEEIYQYEFSKKLIRKEGKILDSTYKGRSAHQYAMEQMSALHPTANPVMLEWVIKSYMMVITTIMRSLEIGNIKLPYLGSFVYNAYVFFKREQPEVQHNYRTRKDSGEVYREKFDEFVTRERHDRLHIGHSGATEDNLGS